MSHDFRIKPLSEGLGLGSLRTPTARAQRQEPMISRSAEPELPTIDIQTMERAREVYRQQSVSAKMKKMPRARAGLWLARAVVGWGLDGVMICLTLVMCSVLGVMSWRFGSGATAHLDPMDALKVVETFISTRGLYVIGIAFGSAWVLYQFVMRGLVGATLGATITGDTHRSRS